MFSFIAPSAPGNVEAFAVSPYQIRVRWTEPEILLSPSILYEIHWTIEGKKGVMLSHSNRQVFAGYIESILFEMMPSQLYEIKVRVYTSDYEEYTDSDVVVVRTYDEPGNITLLEVTPTRLVLQWISVKDDSIKNHSLQYKQVRAEVQKC